MEGQSLQPCLESGSQPAEAEAISLLAAVQGQPFHWTLDEV